jgi:chorismate mutase/prephenate dehydratase
VPVSKGRKKVDRGQGSKNDRDILESRQGEIERIDDKIISLLTRRQAISGEIGKLRKELGIKTFDPAAEQAILHRLSSKDHDELSAEVIRTIFSEIFSAARSVQKRPVVAFLGPEATFSHEAAVSFFGHSSTYRASESIEQVFNLVEGDLCQYGIVPVENSYEGSVRNTIDLFYQYDLKIGAERFRRIRQHLLSKATTIEKIERLYSHPMAIAQCRVWLKTHMATTPVEEVTSTALAAKMASNDPAAGAIGSRLAGETFNLNILEQNIEDIPDNYTRFLVIGKQHSGPTGKDKTSLLFLLNHKPGALHKALGALAGRNINLTQIESRPLKTRNWEYLFFVDVEGHEQQDQMSNALMEMEQYCVFLKRLGSYPSGNVSSD